MKTSVLLTCALFLLALTGCGPAAEDRNAMHMQAKVFQDSIANLIRAQLAEAEGPAAYQYVLDSTAKKRNTAAQAPSE